LFYHSASISAPVRYAEALSSLGVSILFRMASLPTELSQVSPNRKLVLAGQIAFLPTGILQTLLGPMLSILIARWAMNDKQAGSLFLVQFMSVLAGVLLSGVLLSRWGFRPAFLAGLTMMGCGAATLYQGSLWLGMISVAVFGFGIGLVVPADNLLIAEIGAGASSSVNARASAVSLLNFFWGVGAVFGSLMVAWSAAHKLLPLFLYSVAGVLVFLALSMRNLPFPAAASPTDDSASVSWRELAKVPAIWIFVAAFFLYPGAETAVGGWIGSYVSRMGARGTAMASVMPAFFYSALTLGRALGSAFLRHFPERRVLQAGYGAGAAGIALMVLVPSLAGVAGGAVITGLSFATVYPITVAQLSQRFGVAARSIGAVMFSLASVGPAVIPWMVGLISQSAGSLRAGLLLPLAATAILFLIHLPEW
jgi:FHS family glucose/mannose:H+ symporter-like MFS transporter